MKLETGRDQDIVYQITMRGNISEGWLDCFQGLTVAFDGEATTLTGVVADQAALRGMLNWLWDLNLTIVAVTRQEHPQNGERGSENE